MLLRLTGTAEPGRWRTLPGTIRNHLCWELLGAQAEATEPVRAVSLSGSDPVRSSVGRATRLRRKPRGTGGYTGDTGSPSTVRPSPVARAISDPS